MAKTKKVPSSQSTKCQPTLSTSSPTQLSRFQTAPSKSSTPTQLPKFQSSRLPAPTRPPKSQITPLSISSIRSPNLPTRSPVLPSSVSPLSLRSLDRECNTLSISSIRSSNLPTRSPVLPSSVSPLLPLSLDRESESQQELVDETGETSTATQQRPTIQFKNDKERKNKEIFFLLNEREDNYNLDLNSKWVEQKAQLAKNTIPVLLEVFQSRYNTNRNEISDILQQRHKSKRILKSVRKDKVRSNHFDKRIHRYTYQYEVRILFNAAHNKNVSSRRGTQKLHSKKDNRIMSFDLAEMKDIIGTGAVHSPELSDSDNEIDEKENVYVSVCDLSWRLEKLCELLHNVFDTTVVSKHVRPRRHRSFILTVSLPEEHLK
ncbi:27039_t:CDS:2 [Dentiscutata erythropus]|uniref:27039_t:CDS:1 n=1 Tax=Dentiscutata erythropus TaxID=1348616 RepID=A0A9N8VJ74_9GLOM|nr:27039_t:CDS:2 [Dentiscutata erythropus]